MPPWLVEPSNEHNKSEEAFTFGNALSSHILADSRDWAQLLRNQIQRSLVWISLSRWANSLRSWICFRKSKTAETQEGFKLDPELFWFSAWASRHTRCLVRTPESLRAKSWHPQGRAADDPVVEFQDSKENRPQVMFFLQLNWNPHALPWGLFSLNIQIASC